MTRETIETEIKRLEDDIVVLESELTSALERIQRDAAERISATVRDAMQRRAVTERRLRALSEALSVPDAMPANDGEVAKHAITPAKRGWDEHGLVDIYRRGTAAAVVLQLLADADDGLPTRTLSALAEGRNVSEHALQKAKSRLRAKGQIDRKDGRWMLTRVQAAESGG